VNAVVGALDQLSQQLLPAHGRELTALAQHAAQTLSVYVNNLLDLSKSDAGELKLVVQAESLQATLHSAAQAIAPIARARNIEVAVSIDPALAPRHEIDAFRLRQIVLNLLSNAVKFSSESSIVQLRADRVGDDGDSQQLQICVADHGSGISADRLPLLFTPYAQAGDSVVHRSGSTGLGLALCKRLVDAMGGTIAIESLPGIGTRAVVSLTATAIRGADDAVSALGWMGAAAPALRVLLADDDRVQQIVLTALLANAGCIVDVADDGSAAAALWLQHRHRLVITDLKMPIMGGIELARWLRAQPGGSNVLLIGTSADLDEIESALAAGIQRLLSKPVQASLINAAVREVQTMSAPQRVGI
jgi:CheY-like chemotaxis protein/anti-sigma regulatory factor (Ser/Thr protein kinase)